MKILMIEDDHRISNLIKRGLELKAHVVDTAFDGDTGLDLALSESYDVIILDWMLPKRSGLNLVGTIRRHQIHTPVLMLTAKTQIEDRVEGLEAGADDYLGKPFAFAELLARLHALSRRPHATRPSLLTTASLSLNPQTFEVKRFGRVMYLTKKEFALLEYLMRHPGQTFTPQVLTQNVWPYDSDVLPNTAQVYIGYLRHKIDRPFPHQKPLLHTVRGFGYKLKG